MILGSIVASCIAASYPCDKFQYGEGEHEVMEIYPINHGSIVIKVNDSCIFVDPVMNMDGRHFDYTCFGQISNKIFLVTHEHYDHLSKETIDMLSQNPVVFANEKSIKKLKAGTVMSNGSCVTLDFEGTKLKITAVAAYNTTDGHLQFHPKGNGNGYVLEIGNKRIYIAGDTEVIEEMKNLGKIDIAFLPVNQPYTMTTAQCIEAAEIIKPSVLIPYHMGNTDMTPVIRAFENSPIKVLIHDNLKF